MGHIGLILSNPQMTFGYGGHQHKGWRLSFDAALARPWHQSVDLTGPEKFTELAGSVGFEDEIGELYHGHKVGSLTYWPSNDRDTFGEPPGYLVTLRMSGGDIDKIQHSAEAGLPLRSLNITVPAVGYGWTPDGADKKWDNVANPVLEIEGYRLFFGKPEDEDDIGDEPSTPMASSPTELAILAELQRMSKSSRYLLYVFGILTVATIWWHS
jgi:hypothetical protein